MDSTTRPSFDVTYKSIDFEVCPSNLIGNFPSSSIRLQYGNYVPSIVVVSSFLFYYFILVPIIFPATGPKSDKEVLWYKKMRNVHNLALCLYSGISSISTGIWLYHNGELFDWHSLLCTPVEGTWLRVLSVTFTISKLVEWLDTAFLIWLGSGRPEFLHFYHHATTFWLFCFVPNLPGAEKLGLMLNGGVHMMMYSHYWRRWPKSLVPLITLFQIMHLSFVTYVWSVNPAQCPEAHFASAPSDQPMEFFTVYAMVPVFLLLFLRYFYKRYITKKIKNAKKVT